MSTEIAHNLLANEYTYTPPKLPTHLASTYVLKPIVGHPSDEQIKAIHASIRAVSAEAQIPHLHDPELSLQLSQHLFNVQMAIYRKSYPLNLFPADNVYTPPSLPAHIPAKLEPVVGVPSNEQLKAAQNAIRTSESLGISPLFDPDLNMQLSQHLFNLQFARYLQDSSLGRFTSKPEGVSVIEPVQTHSSHHQNTTDSQTENLRGTLSQSDPISHTENNPTHPSALGEEAKPESCTCSGNIQLAEAVNGITELMRESKGILENMNRVLIAIQRNQFMVGAHETHNLGYANPVNDQGVTAVEYGLPRLRFSFYRNTCSNYTLKPNELAGYLRFFGIGSHLTEGDESLQIKNGYTGETEARHLILQYIGME
ncbi:unnamed protein product [Rhizoctonia solani]|uniref:Uncharacterized protein n=1 Tax=Rhizoctonia solani TaxID=456999 RepID=A0A8H3CL31_9AGAM|nr:unnamed protein product [Rhizoctonia solani]